MAKNSFVSEVTCGRKCSSSSKCPNPGLITNLIYKLNHIGTDGKNNFKIGQWKQLIE